MNVVEIDDGIFLNIDKAVCVIELIQAKCLD